MKELHTEIKIKASAERVWEILTDFKRYPEWNQFIRWVKGEAKPGGRLRVRIEPSGARGFTFKPKVLVAEENRELRWLGGFFIPGLFSGEHAFIIEPQGEDKVKFIQHEVFNGRLVPKLSYTLDTDTRRGFEEMNKALKKRAEQKS